MGKLSEFPFYLCRWINLRRIAKDFPKVPTRTGQILLAQMIRVGFVEAIGVFVWFLLKQEAYVAQAGLNIAFLVLLSTGITGSCHCTWDMVWFCLFALVFFWDRVSLCDSVLDLTMNAGLDLPKVCLPLPHKCWRPAPNLVLQCSDWTQAC